ncbi:MAG: T9SS type A sorting domain-containing protein [Bacteroidales bacterium]|jgi:hypothetical protein|nr:T9SS type A sorting domain-containing protein [Bacteroidales bacterium]
MKKLNLFLAAIATICSLTAIGQAIVPPHMNSYLVPSCVQNGTLPLLISTNTNNPNYPYNLYAVLQIADTYYNDNVNGFRKIAQPYVVDTFVSVQGLSLFANGIMTCPTYIEIHKPLGNRIGASIRYDTALPQSSDMNSLRFTELFFDSNIFIKDTFYVVADAPGGFYDIECPAICAIYTSLIKGNNMNHKPQQLCCEDMSPVSLNYNNTWEPFPIEALFGTIVDSGCYPFIYLFPILGDNVYTHAVISDENDTIEQAIDINATITELGHPIPSFIGLIYDSLDANLTFDNPNKIMVVFDSTISSYHFTIPYNNLVCNTEYDYRLFFINSLDTSYGEVKTFFYQCASGGLNEVEGNDSVRLYPNPADKEITITTAIPMQKVEITNASGQKVYEQSFKTSSVKVNTSKFSSGSYIATIHTEKGMVKKQFVVK